MTHTTGTKRIVVFSPTVVTGGPELLHQLVHAIRQEGGDAAICYFPLDVSHNTPTAFRSYEVPVVRFEDSADSLFVIPETATWLSDVVRKGRAAIWWMSVDNYFGTPWSPRPGIVLLKLRALGQKRPIQKLRSREHYYQSEYARIFLEQNKINGFALSDYLNSAHLTRGYDLDRKTDIIVYNPSKGREITARLKEALPNLKFVPISGLSASAVADLLASAKVYIDFGGHPGKDRLPREAAMAGCCVITGRRGSAANMVDIQIHDCYKLSDQSSDFVESFRGLVDQIFGDFQARQRDFDHYRSTIIDEPRVFRQQVAELVERVGGFS